MLEAAGADRVLTMDLHAGQIQGFFQKPVDHMTALFMLTQYFADLGLPDLVVVAPDAGRVKLNKKFASKIGAELAILDKERPAQQVAEIGYVIGDVRGKTAVIVDDMIDTAGTLKAAAKTVKEEGAARVYAAATHAVFSGDAFENLRTSGLEEIVVTDTIPVAPGAPREHARAALRGAADRLDPADLRRRLRQRGLRRREPAVLGALQQRAAHERDFERGLARHGPIALRAQACDQRAGVAHGAVVMQLDREHLHAERVQGDRFKQLVLAALDVELEQVDAGVAEFRHQRGQRAPRQLDEAARVTEAGGRDRPAPRVLRDRHAERAILAGDGGVVGAEALLAGALRLSLLGELGDGVEGADLGAVVTYQLEVDADVSPGPDEIAGPR